MGITRSVEVRVAEFLAVHDGVITSGQALSLGMTRGQIRSRVDRGLWVGHARSTYLSAEHAMTDMARVRIAALAHTGAVIDRTAAAWLHGLIDDLPDEVTLSTPRSTQHGTSCVVPSSIRRRDFALEDLVEINGIAVTALPLTILAAASELGPDAGITLMDRALQTWRVSLRELAAALERNSGAHGMKDARRYLASASDMSESELERRFVRFLTEHGFVGWSQQVRFGSRRLDFAFEEEKIAVSLHGWAFHHRRDRWERDQELTSALAANGWLPLTFTWKRLEYDPEGVLRELSAALALRRNEV